MKIQKDNVIRIRVLLVTLSFLVFALAIAVKLINLFINGDKYAQMAEENMIKEFIIEPNRGNLYSDDGSLLATSVTRYNIRFDALTPSNQKFENLVKPLSDSLAVVLPNSASYYLNTLRRARKLKNRYLLLARDLGYTDYVRIKKFPLLNLGAYKGGIIIEQKTTREYPLGAIAHRSVGYVRKDEKGNITRVGLEGAFDKYLAGEEGRHIKQRIAKGQWKPINDNNEKDPKDGYDVVSSININIQDIAHHALLTQLQYYKADHGCAVVMEVNTGEIKAISNLGRSSQTGGYYERLNYAVGETYEPGSVFKVMSLVTALEESSIDTTHIVDTKKGVLSFYGEDIKDSNRKGYGKISLARSIEVSSNTAIVQTIHDLFHKNPKKFVNRLNQMHLNKPLGLSIQGEGIPKIPQPNSKEWSGISLEWMAFGYGLEMTPLQVLTFYNAIANNGVMVKPRMIKEIKEWNKTIERFDVEVLNERICSEQTVSKVKTILENAVKRGTGKSLYSPNFSMAGKTGTAQKDYKDKSKLGYISSFAGFFPVDNPKYSCIVVIHNPDKSTGYYGADVAGPVFKAIAQKIYTNSLLIDTIEDVEKSSPENKKDYQKYYEISNKYKTIVPNVVGMSAMDAISILENMGLRVRVIGQGRVKTQSIPSGQKIRKPQDIILNLGT